MKMGTTIGWKRCLIMYDMSFYTSISRTPSISDSKDPCTSEVLKFFELFKAFEEPLHEHTKVTVLVFVTRLMAIKFKFAFSNNCYKEFLNLISDVLPKNHKENVPVQEVALGYWYAL
jgi:hypothetical protein